MTGTIPTILRPGFITKTMLSEIVGDVTIDPAIIEPDPNLRPKAPGMKYTHYAPHGTLSIVEAVADESANRASLHSGVKVSYNATEAETLRVAEKIKALVNEKEAQGYKVAILTTKEHASLYKNYSHVLIVGEGSKGHCHFSPATLSLLSHPDYTVGFGISPNHASLRAGYTAGGESHPAPSKYLFTF